MHKKPKRRLKTLGSAALLTASIIGISPAQTDRIPSYELHSIQLTRTFPTNFLLLLNSQTSRSRLSEAEYSAGSEKWDPNDSGAMTPAMTRTSSQRAVMRTRRVKRDHPAELDL